MFCIGLTHLPDGDSAWLAESLRQAGFSCEPFQQVDRPGEPECEPARTGFDVVVVLETPRGLPPLAPRWLRDGPPVVVFGDARDERKVIAALSVADAHVNVRAPIGEIGARLRALLRRSRNEVVAAPA
jgi:DNA-binding response OmpR family regulator